MSGILTDINQQIIGRGKSIVSLLIPPENMLERKECPCYFCEGKTRARWIAAKEILYCNNGCHGKRGKTAIDVAMIALNLNFKEAAAWIRGQLGVLPMTTPEPKPDIEAQKTALNEQLKALQNPKDTEVQLYLMDRGLQLPKFGIAFFKSMFFEKNVITGQSIYKPAMVCKIRRGQDVCGLHTTFLENNKKISQRCHYVVDTITGGYIPFYNESKEQPETVIVGEGVESTLSAMKHFNTAYGIAAINAGGLENFTPPDYVTELIIIADSDNGGSFTGQIAAFKLAQKLKISCEIYAVIEDINGILEPVCIKRGNKSVDFNDLIMQ